MSAPKVVCQYRRARKLAEVIARYERDPLHALITAAELTPEQWVLVADIAGLDTPPSDDTIALTIELLRERTETDA